VLGNYIGTNATATAALGNDIDGVRVVGANNRIGGTTAADRNVISGNGNSGVGIFRGGASENVVSGNYIGTNVTGTTALGNHFSGVDITEASLNTIGGTVAGARNVISGNDGNGIMIAYSGSVTSTPASRNVVAGNYIGTNAAGTADLGNAWEGVAVLGTENTIGGTTSAARNVISGNGGGVSFYGLWSQSNVVSGNYIGTNAAGTTAIGNDAFGVSVYFASNNTIGGLTAGERNVISGNIGDGVAITQDAHDNVVLGNYIGTNAAGTADLGNSGSGVSITARAANNTIGGTAAGSRNVISGNNADGVRIAGGTVPSAVPHDNAVLGNYIGTNAAGTAALGNSQYGVEIFMSPDNSVGGAIVSSRNIISGNGWSGVDINGSFATGNFVASNYIGTNAAGTAALGNGEHGVIVEFAPDNTVGGFSGSRNIISGNRWSGVVVRAGDDNAVSGNYIGLNAAGTAALGNGYDGVTVESGANNVIGGTGFGAGNVISGNAAHGVRLWSGGSTEHLVQGNVIGANPAGTVAIGNVGSGVLVESGSSNNTIGGTLTRAPNIIAFNGGDGVTVSSGSGNAILTNSIRSNGGLGIDLGPNDVTANDLDDVDAGANALQNFPVLTSVVNNTGAGTFTINGTFNSTPNTSFLLQFFASASADPSGYGEGDRLLGSLTVTTDAGGDVRLPNGNPGFTVTFSTTVPGGQIVAATATRLDGAVRRDTSEFSAAATVAAISGRKFHDLDADGLADPGDPGLAGWTIYLDANGDNQLNPGEASTVTDANGNYVLTPPLGVNVVREVMRSDWFQSAPTSGEHTVNVAAGQLYTGRNFGNYRPATISGLKFHDLDGNGVQGAGEPGQQGWTIYIDSNNNGVLDGGEPTEVTDAAGTYEFNQLVPGTYRLREVMQSGWQQSAPQAGFHLVTVASEENVTGRDFGNYRPVTITGTVFHDFDADGVRDGNEPGLPGRRVYLDLNNNSVPDAGDVIAPTDPAGRYVFTGLRPGTYAVREDVPAGWRITAPAASAHVVNLLSGAVGSNRDFGNTPRDPMLLLYLSPVSVSEGAGAGAVMASVIRSGLATTAPLTVSLSSSDMTEAQVPAMVIIPAGQSSATFFIPVVDDLIFDGDQSVLIRAVAPSFISASATLLVTDDEG
jgi:hypothetical protein